MKKYLVMFAKVAISAALLGYLVCRALRPQVDGRNVLDELVEQPKRLDLLAGALAAATLAVVLTLVRWCYLVRAIGVPLALRTAMRIGFLGYLFNLAPMGIVGNDLIRAAMLGRRRPGIQGKALASVLVDRLVGLYMLFVVATAGVLWGGCCQSNFRQLWIMGWTVVGLTATATVVLGAFLFLMPGAVAHRLIVAVGQVPKIGPPIAGFMEALHEYRSCTRPLALAAMLSIAAQVMFNVSILLIDRGLPGEGLSLSQQFVAYPVSAVASVVPLPAGPFEGSFDYLYGQVQGKSPAPKGLVIALVYRLITVMIAGIGLVYYLGERQMAGGAVERIASPAAVLGGMASDTEHECRSSRSRTEGKRELG